jgi:transposase-like protein
MKTSANGRIRLSPAEWDALLSRYEASGRSSDEFCHDEGLCRSTFHNWRRKLRAEKPAAVLPSKDFVERTPATDRVGGWTVEIELPDGTVTRVRG